MAFTEEYHREVVERIARERAEREEADLRSEAERVLRQFQRFQLLLLVFRIVSGAVFAAVAALALLDGWTWPHLWTAACFAGCFLVVLKGDWTCRL